MIPTGHDNNHTVISPHHTKPVDADYHPVTSSRKQLVFEVDSGRLFDAATFLAETGSDTKKYQQHPAPPTSVALQSLSLAIAQKCNLGCTYCYAEQGTFGGKPDNMSYEMAKASVDRLFLTAPGGQPITLAFMGGEPLFNRDVLHKTTVYAAEQATRFGRDIKFSITTNATLIRQEDVALFQQYCFTVTVSIDGIGASNDQLRPYLSGKGSFEVISEKLRLLIGVPDRKFKILARVTVTPKNICLPETFRGLVDLGFDSVQFSPMLKSPTGAEELSPEHFGTLLDQLIQCGESFRHAFNNRQLLPLQNVISTLQRIHFYQREVYPCGAGGGYMGVSAKGDLYACHRFVNDEEGYMGTIKNGVDAGKQQEWLNERHLNNQHACTSCWARHLCSGSCHHEVIKRGRPACDYIRGWLYYCLGLYADLMETDPIGLRLLLGDKSALVTTTETEDGTGINY